jgi:uncharacterized membrane protein
MSQQLIKSTIAAILALSSATLANTTMAENDAKNNTITTEVEKCYGIAKAGYDQCGNSAHACAGQSKVDGDKKAWIAVIKGTCTSIVGGSTEPK